MGSIGPNNNINELQFEDLPPFPDDVPTVPLLRLNLQQLINGDAAEEEKLWKACCELGFFYLDLRSGDGEGLLEAADKLFRLADGVFDLPVEEKQKYDLIDEGSYFGYKGLGKGTTDKEGSRDRNEFWNVSKDDILGISEPLPNPQILMKEENRAKFKDYMVRAHKIVLLILEKLNDRLGFPPNTLQDLHRMQDPSGDQVRWVRSPPQIIDDKKAALGAHTDFGSITVLFNRLGGLQVLPPKEETWSYVKPLRGHCVVNLGDAMVKLTAGVLRSNIHRVVNPPGQQAGSVRYSLVYFNRPSDEVLLKPLEGSEVVDQARMGEGWKEDEEVITAKEWTLRRAMGRRTGKDWKMGTEGGRA